MTDPNTGEDARQRRTPSKRAIVLILLLILLAEVGIGLVVILSLPSWAERGQFGDIFGLANATFSGLAFAGLIYTILLQRSEMALQVEQLDGAKRDLEKTETTQKQIAEALAVQSRAATEGARLTALTALLNHCRGERKVLQEKKPVPTDSRFLYMKELEAREDALVIELRKLLGEYAVTNNRTETS